MRATRVIVSTLGVALAASGMVHGYLEVVHGNTSTGGLLLGSVGAFTVIPNYLITGVTALLVSLAIVIWTIGFIDRPRGPHVFILLSVLLLLVGGGVAQVVFFMLAWALSTRIGKPLSWWRRSLPDGFRESLARAWIWLFTACMALFAVAVEIWLVKWVPGVSSPTEKVHICWVFLVAGLGVLLVDVVAGFAHDLERPTDPDAPQPAT